MKLFEGHQSPKANLEAGRGIFEFHNCTVSDNLHFFCNIAEKKLQI